MGCMNKKDYTKWKPGDKVKPKTITGPGLTKQEFGNETNINTIMERYRKTGQLPAGQHQTAVFADVSEYGSFAETLNKVKHADEAFNALPAAIRTRFANDPVNFIEFLQDVNNRDEAIKLGLIPQPPAPEAPAATPPAPKPEIPTKPEK